MRLGKEQNIVETVVNIVLDKRLKLVSFDIFDTLLWRKVFDPRDVFLLVDYNVQVNEGKRIANFYKLRQAAEQEARQYAWDEHGHQEVTLEEIYDQLSIKYVGKTDVISMYKKYEVAIEKNIVFANPIMLELYKRLKQEGVKVIAISDMYLPKEVVTSMFEKTGFDFKESDIYVSSQFRRSKYTGDLFKIVRENIGVEYHRWMHIGDNYQGEIVPAKRLGIQTFYVPRIVHWADVLLPFLGYWKKYLEKHLHFLKKQKHIDAIEEINYLIRSLLWGYTLNAYMTNVLSNDADSSRWLKWISQGRLLPVLFDYVLWLVKQFELHKSGVKNTKLVLLGRDGYIPYEVIRLLTEHGVIEHVLNSETDLVYLEASRRSYVFSNLRKHKDEFINYYAIAGKPGAAVEEYINRIAVDIPQKELNRVLQDLGLSLSSKIISGHDWAKLKRLFSKLFKVYEQKSYDEYYTIQKYFYSKGVYHADQLLVVDLGWTGGTVRALYDILNPYPRGGIEVKALFFAFNGNNKHKQRLWRKGINFDIYSGDKSKDWKYGEEVLENLFPAPYDTLLYFKLKNGKIIPVRGSTETKSQLELKRRYVKYVLDAFSEFLEFIPKLDTAKYWNDYVYYSRPLVELIRKPMLMEANVLGGITHVEGWGDSKAKFPLAKPGNKKEENYDRFKKTRWKRGFLVQLSRKERFHIILLWNKEKCINIIRSRVLPLIYTVKNRIVEKYTKIKFFIYKKIILESYIRLLQVRSKIEG